MAEVRSQPRNVRHRGGSFMNLIPGMLSLSTSQSLGSLPAFPLAGGTLLFFAGLSLIASLVGLRKLTKNPSLFHSPASHHSLPSVFIRSWSFPIATLVLLLRLFSSRRAIRLCFSSHTSSIVVLLSSSSSRSLLVMPSVSLGLGTFRSKRWRWLRIGLGIRVKKWFSVIWSIGEWWTRRLNRSEEGEVEENGVMSMLAFRDSLCHVIITHNPPNPIHSKVKNVLNPNPSSLYYLSSWQVISPVETVGYVEVVDELLAVQNKSYERPTILIAKSMKREEEIPDGTVLVLTPNMPDVLFS
ncbi:hypothetical protein Fmac_016938 [Flemingia macrophylla]|uniref:Alpha-glucan water dikinase phosphohistidine-like domain-containing protein n=1 Tax=Flemingia macrophylla TaxID=520843 RepID=A0ABD1MIV1_9FABA